MANGFTYSPTDFYSSCCQPEPRLAVCDQCVRREETPGEFTDCKLCGETVCHEHTAFAYLDCCDRCQDAAREHDEKMDYLAAKARGEDV